MNESTDLAKRKEVVEVHKNGYHVEEPKPQGLRARISESFRKAREERQERQRFAHEAREAGRVAGQQARVTRERQETYEKEWGQGFRERSEPHYTVKRILGTTEEQKKERREEHKYREEQYEIGRKEGIRRRAVERGKRSVGYYPKTTTKKGKKGRGSAPQDPFGIYGFGRGGANLMGLGSLLPPARKPPSKRRTVVIKVSGGQREQAPRKRQRERAPGEGFFF